MVSPKALALWVGAVLASSVADAGDVWPEFRGPTANGHSEATGVARSWSEKKNVRWKTPIHDLGWSSPVIWGNQIWLTTAKADGSQMFVVCVDRDSGKIQFDKKLFDVAEPDHTWKRYNSYASPTDQHCSDHQPNQTVIDQTIAERTASHHHIQ